MNVKVVALDLRPKPALGVVILKYQVGEQRVSSSLNEEVELWMDEESVLIIKARGSLRASHRIQIGKLDFSKDILRWVPLKDRNGDTVSQLQLKISAIQVEHRGAVYRDTQTSYSVSTISDSVTTKSTTRKLGPPGSDLHVWVLKAIGLPAVVGDKLHVELQVGSKQGTTETVDVTEGGVCCWGEQFQFRIAPAEKLDIRVKDHQGLGLCSTTIYGDRMLNRRRREVWMYLESSNGQPSGRLLLAVGGSPAGVEVEYGVICTRMIEDNIPPLIETYEETPITVYETPVHDRVIQDYNVTYVESGPRTSKVTYRGPADGHPYTTPVHQTIRPYQDVVVSKPTYPVVAQPTTRIVETRPIEPLTSTGTTYLKTYEPNYTTIVPQTRYSQPITDISQISTLTSTNASSVLSPDLLLNGSKLLIVRVLDSQGLERFQNQYIRMRVGNIAKHSIVNTLLAAHFSLVISSVDVLTVTLQSNADNDGTVFASCRLNGADVLSHVNNKSVKEVLLEDNQNLVVASLILDFTVPDIVMDRPVETTHISRTIPSESYNIYNGPPAYLEGGYVIPSYSEGGVLF